MDAQQSFIAAHLEAAKAGAALPPFALACAAMTWERGGQVLRAASSDAAWETFGPPSLRLAALCPGEDWRMPTLPAQAIPLDENLPMGGRARLPQNSRAFGILTEGAFVAWAAASPMLGIWYVTVETQKAHRGRGYASACLAWLTQSLLREGHAPLYLCEEENVASLRTALAAGYEIMGIWKRWD